MKVSKQTSVILTVETSVMELSSINDKFNILRNTLTQVHKEKISPGLSNILDEVDREIVELRDLIEPILV